MVGLYRSENRRLKPSDSRVITIYPRTLPSWLRTDCAATSGKPSSEERRIRESVWEAA